MGFDKEFKPVLRFMVVSDVHYKDEHTVERERMEQAIKTAYELSEKEEYSKLDALYVVGDFANSGSRAQMLAFKDTLDRNIKEGTKVNLSMASHEFHGEGEEAARLPMILLAPAALGSGAKSAHGRVLVGAAVRFGFVVAQGSYCGDVDVDWSASDYAALVGRTASVPARVSSTEISEKLRKSICRKKA